MFIENKYTLWYHGIISKAKNENRVKLPKTDPLYVYYESHHIIPESMGGVAKILLTAKEHFICHWLLTKMCQEKDDRTKMLRAFSMMTLKNKHQKKRNITSTQYKATRKARSEAMMINNPMHDPKVKAKVSKSNSKPYSEKFSAEKAVELSQKQSERMSGEKHHFFGKEHPNKGKAIHNQEFKDRLSKPKEKVQCPHCGKIGGKPVMIRYHFDMCKLAPNKNFATA